MYLRRERAKCVENGVRVSIIGRRDRLPAMVLPAIESAEQATVEGRKLHLRLAVDYSSREAIAAAAKKLNGHATRERLSAALGGPDVDLLIRTGGEQRLSDFLLWEAAYAELVFTPVMWPDFRLRIWPRPSRNSTPESGASGRFRTPRWLRPSR